MDEASLVRFKASLSCYFPSYVVGSEEILRALPVHLLKRRRNILGLSIPDFVYQKDRIMIKTFQPKIPSPLRNSAVPEAEEDAKDTDNQQNLECPNKVNCDTNTNRSIGTPRISIISRSARRANNGLRRKADSLPIATKQSTEPFSVINMNSSSRSFSSPREVEKRLEKPTHIEPPGFENAAGEISALRAELGKQQDRIRELRNRLSRLDRAERRSANIERKVVERHNRLNDALKSWKSCIMPSQNH